MKGRSLVFIFSTGVLMMITQACFNISRPIAAAAETSPWDWAGVVGTGQSLAVGVCGEPVLSTTQPYHNLKLSLGGVTVPPFDTENSAYAMVPLVETYNAGYPQLYPKNLLGETPHSAMANQISAMALKDLGVDYITAHTIVGESGQPMSALCKGAVETGYSGRAYAATLFEVSVIKRLAAAAGKTYGVGAIVLTHGESDSGNTNYENDLYQLWSDYNTDLRGITGQSQPIPLIVSQQQSCGTSDISSSTLLIWKAGVDYPGKIICSGPKYQYQYADDAVHLTAEGYRQLGEKYGEIYYEKVVRGRDWQPLQPTSAVKEGRVITVNFNVPVAPLVWDSTLPEPYQASLTEWKNGKGFEVTALGSRVTIEAVEIVGSAVKITCAQELPDNYVTVGYAYHGQGTKRTQGTYRWGLLRDSDPFGGSSTKWAQPNYCVSFQVSLPYNTPTQTASPTPSPSKTPGISPTPSRTPSATPTPTETVVITPTPSVSSPQGICTIAYTQNEWSNGATVSITITNNGTTAVNGWKLTWNFPGNQTITNLWNAKYTQSGQSVTAIDAGYNGTIPAGGSINFGFNLSFSGANSKPTGFTLNGQTCQLQ